MADDIVTNIYFSLGEGQSVDDILSRLRNRYPDVVHPHLLADAQLIGSAANEIVRLRAEGNDLRQQLDVLKIELAQARTGKALLEVERLEAENRQLRERLAAGFASTVVIDVSHDDAARKLRQVMRALEKITGPDGGTQ